MRRDDCRCDCWRRCKPETLCLSSYWELNCRELQVSHGPSHSIKDQKILRTGLKIPNPMQSPFRHTLGHVLCSLIVMYASSRIASNKFQCTLFVQYFYSKKRLSVTIQSYCPVSIPAITLCIQFYISLCQLFEFGAIFIIGW